MRVLTPGRPPRSAELLDQTPRSLEALLTGEHDEPPYRARQILHAIYQEGRLVRREMVSDALQPIEADELAPSEWSRGEGD